MSVAAQIAVTEAGTRISVAKGVLVAERSGVRVAEFRPSEIERIVLTGRADIDGDAIRLCLREGVDVVFLDGHGRYRGRIAGPPSKSSPLRYAQIGLARDAAARVRIARAMIAGKLYNQHAVLLRAQPALRDPQVSAALGRLRTLRDRAMLTDDLDVLRGVEGEGAAAYFSVLGRLLRDPAFAFATRTRRPPTDPVNACLSFGYTMLWISIESFALTAGFDTLLGVLHEPAHGRPALALDLAEEFRPAVVDRLVLRLFNRRQLAAGDFGEPPSPDDGDPLDPGPRDSDAPGVHLTDAGRRIFLSEWFAAMSRETVRYEPMEQELTVRQVIERQVWHLARVVTGEDAEYRPWTRR